MKVLLYDYVTTHFAHFVRQFVTTPWDVLELTTTKDRERAKALIADADAMIGQEFHADLTEHARKLKLIHMPGAGVDKFDFNTFPPGCALCNVYEHESPIAEYVMLNVLLHVTEQNRYTPTFRTGKWDGSGRHDGAFHDEALGKTIGIVGFGHIGEQVARRARAFGMKVIAIRRSPKPHPDLDRCDAMDRVGDLVADSDFIVIACPLNDQTRGLIGEKELACAKRSAFVINPSRAHIIDEKALYEALKSRRIAGAALDAWYQYPYDIHQVMHGSQLPFHELDNVVMTPHFSAWTRQMVERRYRGICDNLDRLYRGEALVRVVHQA